MGREILTFYDLPLALSLHLQVGMMSVQKVHIGSLGSPGESVAFAGVYLVRHRAEHRPSHEVVLLAREIFPACESCGEEVKYELLRPVPYLFEDPDFK